MANIQERRSKDGKLISYSIRVHRGRGPDGKQLKPWTATFEVSPTWTEKSAKKKAEAFAATFEKECREGVTSDSRQKFGPYCEYVIDLKERLRTVKHSTISSYRDLATRIIPAIGHIQLKDLRADHLNDLYAALSQNGTRKRKPRATAKTDLAAQLKARKITRVGIAKGSGLSERIISAAVKGESVSMEAAKAVSDALNMKLEDAFEVKGDDRPLSAKTVIEHHRLISTVLDQAEKEGLVPFNVARKAMLPHSPKERGSLFPAGRGYCDS